MLIVGSPCFPPYCIVDMFILLLSVAFAIVPKLSLASHVHVYFPFLFFRDDRTDANNKRRATSLTLNRLYMYYTCIYDI
jgi:hypothetical protein